MRARWSLGVVLLLAACSSTENHSGTVSLLINGPTSLRAVRLQVIGNQTSVTVPTGQPEQIRSVPGTGDTLNVIVVANQGQTLTTPLLVVHLPDTRVPPTLRVLEAAAPDYTLPNASLYTVSVIGPD